MPRVPVSTPAVVPWSPPEYAVLLHDAQAGQWLALSDPCRIISTTRIEEVVACLREVEAEVAARGLIAAGFVAYEAAAAFDAALVTHREGSGFPLLWFALYRQGHPFSWPATNGDLPHLAWQPTLGPETYRASIEQIHRYIAAGDTYQVNFSYRLSAPYAGEFWPLYAQLAAGDAPEFGAYLNIGRWQIGSLSPELFFCREGDLLTSLPMKGTIKRGLSAEDDRQQGRRLHHSAKDRAENVMIVDMVRNDLGRIARPGTVRVEEPFAVRRCPTLWQMTTTVSAQVRRSLTDIFAALFPAASITGAPKARTMTLIRELETTPRRIYTGTIGMLLPDGRAQFNVAIRTLLHDRQQQRLEYGVGGGITADSSTAGEWEETRVKSLVCRTALSEFSLLETLAWRPEAGFVLLEEHLHRLRDSADYFGYPCDVEAVRQQLSAAVAECSSPGCKLRVLLDRSGKLHIEPHPLPLPSGNRPLRLVLAKEPVDANNRFLYHKTTLRQVYVQARATADPLADDVLLYNQARELTETTIANIILTLDGQRYTPPVRCGLLPGTLRQHLLESGAIEERILSIDCLARAEAITLINCVRGQMDARLL